MRPVAVILNDKELVRLLTHLGLPTEFPKFKPAPQASLHEHNCGPPDEDCQPDPKGDLYEIMIPLKNPYLLLILFLKIYPEQVQLFAGI